MKFVGVSSCPTGIAHTYMAAEALEQEAKKQGHEMMVETQGAAGTVPLDPAIIAAADGVVFAADLDVRDKQRFAGKPTVDVGVKKGVHDAPGVIAQVVAAVEEARRHPQAAGATTVVPPTTPAATPGVGSRIRQYLMTGVSYMIPFVAAGGILIALGFMIGDYKIVFDEAGGGITNQMLIDNFHWGDHRYWGALLFHIGALTFGFLVPVLAGFIAYGIADRPGLVPGFTGGAIAGVVGAGFLGGLVAGFLGGFLALYISRWKVPKGVRGVMPVVVTPLLASLITGLLMFLVLGKPLAALLKGLGDWLTGLSGANAILLGLILGLMMCFDLGGPLNKTAYVFATTGLAAAAAGAENAIQFQIMAAVMGSGMVPPLGMALATAVRGKLFTPAERENGKAAWLLGLSFISEGAIPFAAAHPLIVIPSSMAGGGVTGALIMAFGSGVRAPHGGIWVTPLISSPFLFLLALIIGTVITAGLVIVLMGNKQRKMLAADREPVAVAA